MSMKSLTKNLVLCSLVLLGISCSDNDGGGEGGTGTTSLEQTEIKQKIANYYSAPSTSAPSVENITNAFNSQFPGATDIEWKVSNGVYEIEFEINRIDNEAWYDSNANLLMYKYDIALSELPQPVSSAIATDYPGYALDDADRVVKGSVNGYYVDLKKDKTEIHAFYNENGTFISKNLWEDDSTKPAYDASTETPAIESNLTDDEGDALIEAYYGGRDTDIRPSDVPAALIQSFNTVFPGARDIDWETSANVYKVDFEINNVDYDAWYTSTGTLIAYRFDVTRSSLPQSVRATITSRFPDYSIDDAEKVVKTNSTGYQVELESRNMEEDAYILEDGTYVSNVFYKTNSNPGTPEPGTPTDPVTPEIPADGDYTDEEIDQILLDYERGRDTDVRPSEVPTALSAAFTSQFPGAYDIDWERVNTTYKVDFEIGNTDYEAWYDQAGTILMYTQEVRYNTIPVAVQNAVSSRFSDYIIDGCDYFQKGTIKGYIIELENRRTDAELIVLFAEDGTFLHQQND